MRYTIFSEKDNAYLIAENIVNCKPIRHEIQKLGQYEDNDEKLGIDYNTLFKALNDRVYFLENGIIYCINKHIVEQSIVQDCGDYYVQLRWAEDGIQTKRLFLKDYRKTWAFTPEELKQ